MLLCGARTILIDGKVLRGPLEAAQARTYLLATYLPSEGLVLMEVELAGSCCEIVGAAKLLNVVDWHEKVVLGDAMHTKRAVSI